MSATTANEFNAAAGAADAATTVKSGMSGWGCAWRITGAIVLFAIAVVAVCYGAQYAVAYVVGLELSALATQIITWAIVGTAYASSAVLGWMTGTFCTKTLSAREAAKCASAA